MMQRSERKDAASNRELILDTASQLFQEHGIDSVSMHQIAKAAGVGQGTLYRRYSSKAELCLDLFTERFGRFAGDMKSEFTPALKQPVREKLAHFLACWIDFVGTELQWFNAIKPDAWCIDDNINVFQSEPFSFVIGSIKQLLDEAVANGEIRSLDAEFAAFQIATSMSPIAFAYFTEERGQSAEQLKEQYLRYYDRLFFG
ncbi:TetR/AcrR family transcriptional regulator [Paenibacillus sp. OV219]|uniref:TetR/AcrR family transcriptional regulator n=1 Tax=Paenibacillus sp. OV219 TaxID=1884377 RepID=UPI0008D36548|nr:TetR/AcrR family transcriptional regulator [Paenibacillus sp. OV219]SEN74254.1 transcriptional regulator, TetR family [Paenibacillus sp. OV219]